MVQISDTLQLSGELSTGRNHAESKMMVRLHHWNGGEMSKRDGTEGDSIGDSGGYRARERFVHAGALPESVTTFATGFDGLIAKKGFTL
jgi:hypothetical protein